MPRRPSVNYWKTKGAWGCQFRGKQVVLAKGPDDFPNGPTYQAALAAFNRLTSGKADDPVEPVRKTLNVIWGQYKSFIRSKRKASTLAIRERLLLPFLATFGERSVDVVKGHEVLSWVAEQRRSRPHPVNGMPLCWGDGSERTFWDSLNAMLNWAVSPAELISRNPFKTQEKPAAGSRGEEAVISPEDHLRVLQAMHCDHWKDYVIVLEATGARPGEIANAEPRHVDHDRKAIIYSKEERIVDKWTHKTAKHDERVIYLDPVAYEIICKRCNNHPGGTLFGFTKGRKACRPGDVLRPWHTKAIVAKFARLRDKLNLPGFTAYSYRHTFATAWLSANRSVEKLAHLLGTSPQMIHKHYAHLLKDRNSLQREAMEFRRNERCDRGEVVKVGEAFIGRMEDD